jgi:Uma2 family endonuclease
MNQITCLSPGPSKKYPPLQHGDHLTRDEFERRWENEPDLKHAELLNGMVFLGSYPSRCIDPNIPPLENGDHLTHAEFERRWENMPDLKKVELLNGMVFMAPPISASYHGIPHSRLIFWLVGYASMTPGVLSAIDSTLRTPQDNDPQPDGMLLIKLGGGATTDDKGYVLGTPEFVAEVAASTISYDLHLKLDIYRRIGIPEYLVWRTYDQAIDWFVLRDGRYELLDPAPDGTLHSRVFPGLWLDPAALIAGDLAAVMRLVQQGAATPEHAGFVSRLGKA